MLRFEALFPKFSLHDAYFLGIIVLAVETTPIAGVVGPNDPNGGTLWNF
jgi:hypothetical protein